MKVAQETLGHSMLSLTADTYTSLYPTVARNPPRPLRHWYHIGDIAGTDLITLSSHPRRLRAVFGESAGPAVGRVEWNHDLTDMSRQDSVAMTPADAESCFRRRA